MASDAFESDQPSREQPGRAGGHDADPDATADMLEQLQGEVNTLRAERDTAQAAYKQSLAEFANYQRRALLSEQQASAQAVRRVLESIIPVLDHFEHALNQNPETATTASVIDGVTMIRDELLRALTQQGVSLIRPAEGDEFDANRHKAIVQQPGRGVEPGRVLSTLRPGFALGDRVVRPAEVVVAS